MKILVAINATKPKIIVDNSLRWCARLGLELRIFIPRPKHQNFKEAIDDTNYHWYVDVKHEQLVTRTDAMSYAEQHGYDLLLTIPGDLVAWRKNTQFKDYEIFLARGNIGSARVWFGQHPGRCIKRFANGAVMRRVNK